MDCEKILLCYRDDGISKAMVFDDADDMRIVAAIPCAGKVFGKKHLKSLGKVKKSIAELYETSGAEYLWLEDNLCEYLHMEKMDLPDFLVEKWLGKIPFYHTLIFADDEKGRALRFIENMAENSAAVCVVCETKYVPAYEELAENLFLKEGILLQVLTYEMFTFGTKTLEREILCKGRTAVLDFADKGFFWDKRLLKDMGYYSFWKEMRLFLDTFQKNRYNTLTK